VGTLIVKKIVYILLNWNCVMNQMMHHEPNLVTFVKQSEEVILPEQLSDGNKPCKLKG